MVVGPPPPSSRSLPYPSQHERPISSAHVVSCLCRRSHAPWEAKQLFRSAHATRPTAPRFADIRFVVEARQTRPLRRRCHPEYVPPPSPSLLCSVVYIYTIANHGFVTPNNSLDDPRRHAPLNRPDVSLVIYHTLPTNPERNAKKPPNLSAAIYWALSRAPDNDGPSHPFFISTKQKKKKRRRQRGNEGPPPPKKKRGKANTSPRPIGDLPGPASSQKR